MIKITKKITAMLLSGLLVIGSASGSVLAASTDADVDPGRTSEIAEEAFIQEGAAEYPEVMEDSDQTFDESCSEEASSDAASEAVWDIEAAEESGETGMAEGTEEESGYIEPAEESAYIESAKETNDNELIEEPEDIEPAGESAYIESAEETNDIELIDESGYIEPAEESRVIEPADEPGDIESAEESDVDQEEFSEIISDESSAGGEPDPNEGPFAPFGEVASGVCGDHLTWTLDDEGSLIISGTGVMTSSPWSDKFSGLIKKVTVGDGVTGIVEEAFARCGSLTEVTIPRTVTMIGDRALVNCNCLTDVFYAGAKTDWNRISLGGDNEYLQNAALHCARIVNINDAAVSKIQSATYNGRAQKPEPQVKIDNMALAAGVDYTISYSNNTHVGTATVTVRGINNFNGTKAVTFNITKAAQSITVKSSASPVAAGETAVVSIAGAKGEKSFTSSDKTIAAVDPSTGKVTAKKVGKVTITATSGATKDFKAASKAVSLKIVPAATEFLKAANQAAGIRLNWKKVAGANAYFIYRGSTQIAAIRDGSAVTYTDRKANTNGTKYVYKIIASASVTGRSTLSKSVTVYCVARPAVSTLTNSAASKMTVKWGKNARATGYQIQYSTSKTFSSGNKTANVNSASTVSKVIGNLEKGKTYYVRIRTYKNAGNSKYWSAWSSAKSVKISK